MAGLARATWFYPLASAALVLAGWSAVVGLGLVPVAILPGPWTVAAAGIVELMAGRLLGDLAASLARLAGGYVIGAAAGVVLGLVLGSAALARKVVLPWIEILRPIPPLAWIPVALIWFGIGEGSKLFLIAMTAFFPVAIATLKGVRQIEQVLLRAARSLDVTPRQMLLRVVLPAAMPDVVTGLRLGWTLGITILVGAEMIAASSGLGHMVMNGMNSGRFELVILGILLLGTLGLTSDALFARLTRARLLRWHAGLDKASG